MTAFFKKNWYLVSLLAILFIAGAFRFYQLGSVPHGMTWDEAAIGYNGSAIFTTRRDEWLTRLPVSFRSFGDYKAPLAIYLSGFFTFVFGMNLFAVRLPFFIFSIFGILGTVLLTKEVFLKHKYAKHYALFAGFLIATSPWHFHYSRTGFESGIALTLFIWGLYGFFKSLHTLFADKTASLLTILGFAGSMYAYHSSKVVVPLMLVALFIFYFASVIKNIRKVVTLAVAFVVLLIPLIKDSLYGEGLTRAGVSIVFEDISFQDKVFLILKNYGAHFSPQFLLFGETTTLRHGTGYLGVLFITTLVLILAGLVRFLKEKMHRKQMALFILIVVIGFLPASVSSEVPHSNRSLLALPGFIMLAVYGLDYVLKKVRVRAMNKSARGSHGEKNIIVTSIVGLFLMVHSMFFIAFLGHYFTTFAAESAEGFKDGYLDAFEIVKKYEYGEGVNEVDTIIFTSDYGQPYIYALFARKTNPIWYQGGSLIKYEFYDDITISDLSRKNALIVGSNQDELPLEKADHIIYGSDHEMKFQIYRTKEE